MSASPRFDPQPPDRSSAQQDRSAAPSRMAEEAGAPAGIDLLQIVGTADQLSRNYQLKTVNRPLARSYRAWHNQHAEDSKYLGAAFRGRSKLFVPKTRSAVRKNLATAAAALFSTEDVVNMTASFEDDPVQMATAAVIKADMDYRLTQASGKSGFPWFMLAMGGCLDANLTGVTISKQYWEYEEVPTLETETITVEATHPETGDTLFDESGMAMMIERVVPKMRVTKDRPMVDIHPIENAIVDPAAPWYSPAQLGRWFAMRIPIGLSDLKAMMASGGKGGSDAGWLDVPDEVLLKGRTEEERTGVRRLREGGADRYADGRGAGQELDLVWIQENFVRVAGIDYHFWSIGRYAYLSRVRETREAYPEFDGDRPYHMGVAQLDSHTVFPKSPVETWQPLQLELNDIANLRLDTLKRSIAPLAVVKRGKNVDLGMVQRRGQPDAMLLVDDMGDVDFKATPGPAGAAYTESSYTNAQFDELAGVFSTSSVQSNRQLNETVGGMRMMSGAANSVSEFDLRIWCETWVEPVLRQIAHLIRFWESDERVMAIAGQKARVWQRYQYMPSLSDFDQAELTMRVNVGIGSLDPMQKLAKLKGAAEMLAPMFPLMKEQGIVPNAEAFIEEVMGGAGFKDGRRFFHFGDPQQQQAQGQGQQDPRAAAAMAKMEIDKQKLAARAQEVMATLASKERQTAQTNQTRIAVAQISGRQAGVSKILDAVAAHHGRSHQADLDQQAMLHGQTGQMHQTLLNRMLEAPQGAPASMPGAPAPGGDVAGLIAKLSQQVEAMAQREAVMMQLLQGVVGALTGGGRPAAAAVA